MNKFLLFLLGAAICGTVNAALGNAIAYLNNQADGYSGIRSVLQWNLARTARNNTLFHNYLYFDVGNTGYFGLANYESGQKYKVQMNIWNSRICEPGAGSVCLGFNSIYGRCDHDNFELEDHKLYYLDVELANKTITGYISEPQTSLDTFNTTVNRVMVCAFTMPEVPTIFTPKTYYVDNVDQGQHNCAYANDLTVVNFPTGQYKKYEHPINMKQNTFLSAYIYGSDCKVVNQQIALTAEKDALVYLTRPTIY